MKYIRCYTCGRHLPAADALGEHFCSKECLSEYSCCPVCRRYFRREKDWLWGKWCSEECLRVEQGDKTIEVTL